VSISMTIASLQPPVQRPVGGC